MHSARLQLISVLLLFLLVWPGFFGLEARANLQDLPETKFAKVSSSPSVRPGLPKIATEIDDRLIVNTDLINLTVRVTDSSDRCVPELKKNDFTVLDEKHPQEICFSDDDVPYLSVFWLICLIR
ncbi:MAG: hypothetical protein ND866_21190 [Pyrinomonadaceae bacterium]|nr:hypothetical protein [Pyrinomonadaceae bacterium]